MDIRPIGFNVLVEPDPIEEKTAGGFILSAQDVDVESATRTRGTLVEVSPMAFAFPDWPEGEPKPKAGDRVFYARYSGASSKVKDGERELLILKDEDITAVITNE